MRITQFHLWTGRFSQTGFNVHYSFYRFLCSSLIITCQPEHLGDVFLIFVTDVGSLFVFFQIIIALSHSDTTLIGLYYIHRTVHIIRTDKHREVRPYTSLLTFGNVCVDFVLVFQRIDSGQFVFNRSYSLLVQLHTVHCDIVKVANFLSGASRSIVRLCGQFGNQGFQLFTAVLTQHIECSETGIFVSQRVIFHPTTTRILIKTCTRHSRGIQISKVDTGRQYGLFLTVTSCCHKAYRKNW